MKKILVSLFVLNMAVFCNGQVSVSSSVKSLTTPSICMVTCNEAGTFNEIRWTRSLVPEAVTMIILRSSKEDKFIEIARTSASSGVFTDNSGDVAATSYKYLIQYEDKDHKLSGQSLPHQSLLIKGDQKECLPGMPMRLLQKIPRATRFITFGDKKKARLQKSC